MDLACPVFSIRRDESRVNPFFIEVTYDDLFTVLDGFFCGSLYDALRASAEEQTWARHVVSPGVSASISSRMYLIGGRGDRDRLLVLHGGKRQSFTLAEGAFDKALDEIIERLEGIV